MNIQEYFIRGGDLKFRYTHQLNEDSLVLDIGGYRGEWAFNMFSKYKCHFLIFEPVEKYYKFIQERFKDVPKVEVFNFGLSDISTETPIYLNEDGTSIYSKTSISENIQIKNIVEFIKEKNIQSVDLIKINAEGVEYEIMEELIKNDLINIVKKFQIQYHKLVPKYEERRNSINKYLKQNNYKQLYCFDYVWEEWEKE